MPPRSYSAAKEPQEEAGEGGARRQDSSRTIQRQLSSEEYGHQQRGVDVLGGCRDRRSGVVYDTENPLFDFNVLVTGLYVFLYFLLGPHDDECGPGFSTCTFKFEYRVALYCVSGKGNFEKRA